MASRRFQKRSAPRCPTTARANSSNGRLDGRDGNPRRFAWPLTLLGGFTRQGATTNAGWFALIVALMCLPFGGLLLTLGLAKWLRNSREAKERKDGCNEGVPLT